MKGIFAIVAAAMTVAMLPGTASAADAGYNYGWGGTVTQVNTNDGGGIVFTGTCQYVRYAAGIGGEGITYTIVGAGSAVGTHYGIPVVATGVRCRLWKDGQWYVAGPEYLPGPASETDYTFTTMSATAGTICLTVYAVLRQHPPGASTNLVTSPEVCR